MLSIRRYLAVRDLGSIIRQRILFIHIVLHCVGLGEDGMRKVFVRAEIKVQFEALQTGGMFMNEWAMNL